MKPATGFAVGLWTGALLVLGVGAFNWRAWQQAHSGPSPELTASLQAKEEELQRLRQENASLAVEVQQLRRSVLESKNSLATQSTTESPRVVRRIPFRRSSPEVPATDRWIANAVAHADSASLAQLEAAASQNNELAVEGLALLADRDNAAALMRVWGANSLNDPTRIQVTRLLAATLEANPQGEEWLQGLFSATQTDRKLLVAALVGLANPAFTSTLAQQDPRISPPPRFAVDVANRLRLFDSLRATLPEEKLQKPLDRMRAELTATAPAQ